MTSAESVAGCLGLLGSAYRGDWSDFDGRSLRAQLDELADALNEGTTLDVQRWAHLNGICPHARQWHEHCAERGSKYHWCRHYDDFLGAQP